MDADAPTIVTIPLLSSAPKKAPAAVWQARPPRTEVGPQFVRTVAYKAIVYLEITLARIRRSAIAAPPSATPPTACSPGPTTTTRLTTSSWIASSRTA